MRVATGVDDGGNTLQSSQRMKEIESVISNSVDENQRLRVLLIGLGSITKDESRLGEKLGFFLMVRFFSSEIAIGEKFESFYDM